MNLILLEPDDLDAHGEAELSGTRARHVAAVLGAQPGDTVRIGMVDGPTGSGRVVRIDGSHATLACTWTAELAARPAVDVLLALPRPKVMRRLWAQLAALGVGQIILTNAEKVERNYFDTHVLAPESYRPLLIEGLQQARDTRLPAVSIHRQFRVLIEDTLDTLFPTGVRLLADPAAVTPLADAAANTAERLLLAIGPEGGWNAFETGLLNTHGFHSVGLGPRTLRTDTACVALLSIAHAVHGSSQRLSERSSERLSERSSERSSVPSPDRSSSA